MTIKKHFFRSYALRNLINTEDLATRLAASRSVIDPLAAIHHTLEGGGDFFMFNFGSIVFWNVPITEHAKKIEEITGQKDLEIKRLDTDEFIVEEGHEKSKVEFNRILVNELTTDRAEVIASTLAQSSTMEYYEELVENAWKNIDGMVEQLEIKGSLSPFPYVLHRRIAQALSLRSRVVRVLHLLDRPDLIWEDKVMDDLYGDLRAIFDLPERFQAIEYKLQLIQNTLELLVDVVRDRRLYWLEFAIVFLITFDICLYFLEKFGLF